MATRHSTAVPFTAKTGRVLCGPMNNPVTMIWRLMDGSQLFGQQKVPIVEENAVVSEKSFESATLEMIIYPPKIIHLLGLNHQNPSGMAGPAPDQVTDKTRDLLTLRRCLGRGNTSTKLPKTIHHSPLILFWAAGVSALTKPIHWSIPLLKYAPVSCFICFISRQIRLN